MCQWKYISSLRLHLGVYIYVCMYVCTVSWETNYASTTVYIHTWTIHLSIHELISSTFNIPSLCSWRLMATFGPSCASCSELLPWNQRRQRARGGQSNSSQPLFVSRSSPLKPKRVVSLFTSSHQRDLQPGKQANTQKHTHKHTRHTRHTGNVCWTGKRDEQ
jgi:hypothetical protein